MRLPSAYQPAKYEAEIYAKWEAAGVFTPKNKGEEHFSLVAPPPNANADLHIGYGLTAAIEDIAARYARLKGRDVLFVPGADHAGFETWVVYEKKLNEQGKSRFDFSREELYKQVWDFVAANRANFEKQFRQLGASVSWPHFTFTLDDKVVKQAYATFKKMWQEGLIYRGERLVNFCTFHGTSFADVEVEFRPLNGHLWHISYPLTDDEGSLVIATTRPETMLGDVALAVHPKDSRYKKFIGKTVRLPLTERDLPVIADESVDMQFGSGVVKVTPAHDMADFDIADRHDLPKVSVIATDGTMTNEAGDYRGLNVAQARQKVLNDLKEQGSLVKVEPYRHSVGHCYKCGTIIQPLLKEQWFVDTKPLAAKAISALRQAQINFYPASKKDQLIAYFEGLRDWNISRQIAWGIPIPAFQNQDDPSDWIFDERVDQETVTVDGKTYHRDPDVFDTWFSSSSWPYVTLNYPDGAEYQGFYPLSLMETGGEILYPWVSRMIMLGLYETGKVPFKDVYIHGYVLAPDGSKMSKSLGNVVDLTEVIDRYGSDALRMGIIAGRLPAINRGYDERKIEDGRNFCNKLWNIARFSEEVLATDIKIQKTIADDWILWRLHRKVEQLDDNLKKYELSESYELLYHFVWNDFADWYIEASKVNPNPEVLRELLETTLKLAHPFAPFVTEAIWQSLKFGQGSLLAGESWPRKPTHEEDRGRDFREGVIKLVREVRGIQSDLGRSGQDLLFEDPRILDENRELVKHLAKVNAIRKVNKGSGLRLTSPTRITAWLAISDGEIKDHLSRVEKNQRTTLKTVKTLENRLKNRDYVAKAPASVIEQTKSQLKKERAQLVKIEEVLKVNS
ncbi:MAG: valine--tRNA ligase [Candidatus Saccharimonadales bacterium]